VGIARIMQCGWYKEVRVKDLDSHATKALLVSRALLAKIKRDIENQIRGLLKNLGLVIGREKMNTFAARAAEVAGDRPELAAAVDPLLKAREAVEQQVLDLDRKVLRLARNNAQVRRLMTAPGVGPVTALCFLATIDDPARFFGFCALRRTLNALLVIFGKERIPAELALWHMISLPR
jgi:transposase